MEFFRIKKDIPFMRHAKVFNLISALTFVAAVFFLVSKGLHLSIEFTGGTIMEVSYSRPANLEEMRKTIAGLGYTCLLYTSPSPRDGLLSRMPSSA